MRIGLFSDMYFPSINGISFVLDMTHRQMTALGHEVYIFAPASNLRGVEKNDPDYVIRFPAIEGVFFDEQLTSVFFPPAAYQKIHRLNLDIVHFFTPGQIGLQGVYCALKDGIPLVSQYSTDVYHYVEKYPKTLAATISLPFVLPFILRLTPRESVRMLSALKPKKNITQWHKDMVLRLHREVHNRCDAVIALSRKMQKQLDSWESHTPVTLLPSGVDVLPQASTDQISGFKQQYGIPKRSIVFLYAGRVSREKNLELLVDAFEQLPSEQSTTLVFAGTNHSRKLVDRAAHSLRAKDITFTGRYDRSAAHIIYASADIFLFPSLTDTQGLVVHEAASMKLPLIMCDDEVSEVFVPNETGLLAKNDSRDYAEKMQLLANDAALRKRMGEKACDRARQFTEKKQAKKLEMLYRECIK